MSGPHWRKESAGFIPATSICTKLPKRMGKILLIILDSHESVKFVHVVCFFDRTSLGHKTRSYES